MNKHYIMKALALVMAICCATQWAMAEEKDDGQFVYNTFKADVGAETNADCVEILGFSPSYPDDGGDTTSTGLATLPFRPTDRATRLG